jgi:hypothetical protein
MGKPLPTYSRRKAPTNIKGKMESPGQHRREIGKAPST